MHYYVIHLPLEIPKELIYCSSAEIVEGARVIVNLSGRLWTGICGKKTLPEEGKDIRYKAVIEILDTVPVLSPELMKLGHWMADTTIVLLAKHFSLCCLRVYCLKWRQMLFGFHRPFRNLLYP